MSHNKHVLSENQNHFTDDSVKIESYDMQSSVKTGLYIVATPIGNLEDITLRAIKILKTADIVFCEDTRQTQKLLSAHGIVVKRLMNYHEHNGEKVRPFILEKLAEGLSVALVSDAGTPLISDPGYKLVVEARQKGYNVFPIPGASSVTTALCAAGLPSNQFLFAGFLPPKSGLRTRKLTEFSKILSTTLIFLEAPHRLDDFARDAFTVLGDRQVVIARELTKKFEQFWRGTLNSLCQYLTDNDPFKGEIVVLIAPVDEKDLEPSEEQLKEKLALLMETVSLKEAVKQVQTETQMPRTAIYDLALQVKEEKQ